MIGAIVALYALPYISSSEVRSSAFRPLFKIFYWLFVANFIVLAWIGQNHAEPPFVEIGQVATAYYFAWILIIIPGLGKLESFLLRNGEADINGY